MRQFMLLTAVSLAIGGCSSERDASDSATVPANEAQDLSDTAWQVSGLPGAQIADGSAPTLQFVGEDQVAGSTGCNRYFGTVSFDGNRLSLSQMGSTRRACPPPLMEQEQRFLDALDGVARFAVDGGNTLRLYDESGTEQLTLIASQADPSAARQDTGGGSVTRFDCGEGGELSVRFLGSETVEANFGGRTAILERQITASGARYAGAGVDFWNKGDEAMLTVEGAQYDCIKWGQ